MNAYQVAEIKDDKRLIAVLLMKKYGVTSSDNDSRIVVNINNDSNFVDNVTSLSKVAGYNQSKFTTTFQINERLEKWSDRDIVGEWAITLKASKLTND